MTPAMGTKANTSSRTAKRKRGSSVRVILHTPLTDVQANVVKFPAASCADLAPIIEGVHSAELVLAALERLHCWIHLDGEVLHRDGGGLVAPELHEFLCFSHVS